MVICSGDYGFESHRGQRFFSFSVSAHFVCLSVCLFRKDSLLSFSFRDLITAADRVCYHQTQPITPSL